MTDDPIKASHRYLVDCGWTNDQARNLMSSLSADSAEQLWELAPQWIEYCGEAKKMMALLESVALGPLIRVSHNGEEWCYALREGVTVEKA